MSLVFLATLGRLIALAADGNSALLGSITDSEAAVVDVATNTATKTASLESFGVVGRGLALETEERVRPWLLPDGETVLFQKNVAKNENDTQFQLYRMTVGSKSKPVKIAGASDVAVGAPAVYGKTLRFLVHANRTTSKTCLVEVPLAKPTKTKQLGCVTEANAGCVLSPGGRWFACMEYDDKTRVRFVEVTNQNKRRVAQTESGTLLAVSDAGYVVIDRNLDLVVLTHDGGEKKILRKDHPNLVVAKFRNDKELVRLHQGKLSVIDVTK